MRTEYQGDVTGEGKSFQNTYLVQIINGGEDQMRISRALGQNISLVWKLLENSRIFSKIFNRGRDAITSVPAITMPPYTILLML